MNNFVFHVVINVEISINIAAYIHSFVSFTVLHLACSLTIDDRYLFLKWEIVWLLRC